MIKETKKVKRYNVDLYADGSEIELMTRSELIRFAEEQVCEWFNEITLQVVDDNGNINKKYAEAYRIADNIYNEGYNIKGIAEVEELFKLPAITIPFEEVYV